MNEFSGEIFYFSVMEKYENIKPSHKKQAYVNPK